jgi:hypothetical protein
MTLVLANISGDNLLPSSSSKTRRSLLCRKLIIVAVLNDLKHHDLPEPSAYLKAYYKSVMISRRLYAEEDMHYRQQPRGFTSV